MRWGLPRAPIAPFIVPFIVWSTSAKSVPVLLFLRRVHVAFSVLPLVAFIAIPLADKRAQRSWLGWVAIALAVAWTLVATRMMDRRVDAADEAHFPAVYRSAYLVKAGSAVVPVLFGLQCTLNWGDPAFVFIGAVISEGLLALVAPTRDRVAKLGARLAARGVTVDPVSILMEAAPLDSWGRQAGGHRTSGG